MKRIAILFVAISGIFQKIIAQYEYEEVNYGEASYNYNYDDATYQDSNYDEAYYDYQQKPDEADLKEKCAYLNSVRANYTACCKYPGFVTPYNVYSECYGEPCSTNCCFFKTGILLKITDDYGSERIQFDRHAMAEPFLMSISDREAWTDVVMQSIEYCYSEGPNLDELFTEYSTPKEFYDFLDCVFDENFKNCPTWNSYSLDECEYTSQYVEKCVKFMI